MQKIDKNATIILARCGLVAGLYIVLSLVSVPVGAVQFRLSEGLTLLPLIMPESVVALFVGCILTNVFFGCAILDILLGSLITLLSAVLTYFVGKIVKNKVLSVILGGIFPVLLNALFLPIIWVWCYGAGEYVYILQALILFASQSLSVYGAGIIFYSATKKIIKI